MKLKNLAFLFSIVALTITLCSINNKNNDFRTIKEITSIQDLKDMLPKNIQEIQSMSKQALEAARHAIEKITTIAPEDRTYENTVHALDRAYMDFYRTYNTLNLLEMVSPNDAIRQTASQESVNLKKESIDLFSQNKKLYEALKGYAENQALHESLSPEDNYFITEMLKGYKTEGLDLPDEQRSKVIAIKKELEELCSAFSNNIATDAKTITVTKEELAGLDENFISNLQKTEAGLYILGTDYPTYFKVMAFCSVGKTREKIWRIFNQRAYPENTRILEKIIEKRDALAQALGFKSFAHFSLVNEMAESPEKVEQFLHDLITKVTPKAQQELKTLTEQLPAGIQLSPDGKLQPWDATYVVEMYKKNVFNIDENEISNYFPMENTLQQLLDIYRQFLDVQFEEIPVDGLWHTDVTLVSVSHNNQLCGYLYLDLYPRKNKFNHACQTTLIPALKNDDNTVKPAVAAVIANFPKSTATQPSLLKRSDVTTFFHEFGHALHALLGATKLGTLSGTSVKTDFVEMPSQMLEEWLLNPAILKQVSSHYQTGESLPDATIATLLELKNLTSGMDLQRQLSLASFSLECFKDGAHKDIHALYKKLYHTIVTYSAFCNDTHFYTAFGHLTDYNAKYYGYLWSKVYALDLFDHIQTHGGLLNPAIGTQYKNKILAFGGSKNPNELIEDFLGRKPNAQAFMRDMGL